MGWIIGAILAGNALLVSIALYKAAGEAMDRDTRNERQSIDDRQ